MRKIEWSLEAQSHLNNIVTYLENEWTEKEIRYFSERLDKQLSVIVQTPDITNNLQEKQRSSGMSYHKPQYTFLYL